MEAESHADVQSALHGCTDGDLRSSGGPCEHVIAAGRPLVRTQHCLFIRTEKVTLFIGLLIFKISEIINEAVYNFSEFLGNWTLVLH